MSTPFKIEVFSHGVRVSGLHLDITVQLKPFLEELTQRETEESYDYRSDTTSYRSVIRKKYFVQTEDGRELFIHREYLDPFLEMLKAIGCTKYELTHAAPYEAGNANVNLVVDKIPRPYQDVIIKELIDSTRTRNVCLGAGMGKALPLDTPVRIPNGFKPMGDIRVGDTVLAGNGDITTVTGWYPDDDLEGMRITLEDGRQLRACVDHQFSVRDSRTGQWSTMTTRQMFDIQDITELHLPLPGYYIWEEADLPYDPRDEGWEAWHKKRDIPESIFSGTHRQMEDFMESFLDGCWDWDEHYQQDEYSFTFQARTLSQAKGLQRLAWVLGAICTLDEDTLILNAEHLTAYNDDYEDDADRVIRVIKVERAGRFKGACISVSHPTRLYQAGDYIVTHNTFCALKAVESLKKRTMLMLLPKYFGLWEKAIREDVLPGVNCEVIKGSSSIRKLIDRAIEGQPLPDIIFMSVTSYRGYIEALERYGSEGMKELGYSVPPYRFHETLGIGIQINDEIQDDPGVYYRVDTVSHMTKEIFLTATPYTGSDKLTEMIRVMMHERFDVTIPDPDKYTHVVGIRYNDPGVNKRDYRGYKNAYSHVNYEAAILKNKPRKDRYFRNVARVVFHYFKQEHQKNQKMIIYCATHNLIWALTDYLKKEFPEFVVNAYLPGVETETLQTNDITVSTIKSCGAGVDIPNLKEALMLVATNSKKDSIQAMRRPRPLVNYKDVNPRFSYFICNQIPKHMGYAKNKHAFFAPFALTHVDRRIG